jgi:hypothetical protein
MISVLQAAPEGFYAARCCRYIDRGLWYKLFAELELMRRQARAANRGESLYLY